MPKFILDKIVENERNAFVDGAYLEFSSFEERIENIVQKAYRAGYDEALGDLQLLSNAVDVLKNFAEAVGGSSSFWEETWYDFEKDVFKTQIKIIRESILYNSKTNS